MTNTLLSALITFLSVGDADFNDLSDEIVSLINNMWVPCVAVASAFSVVWGIWLGVKYWLAGGDEQKKKSAQSMIISFVIGIIIIFVVAVGAPMLIAALTTWISG